MNKRLIPDSARSTQLRFLRRLAGEPEPVDRKDWGLEAKRSLIAMWVMARKER